MVSKNAKMWLGIIAISLSSSVVGGVATAFYIKHRVLKVIEQGPKGVRIIAMRALRRRLDLSPQQVEEIRPIVKNAQGKLHEFRQSHRAEILSILNQSTVEINSKLDPRQQQEFDKITRKLMKRFFNKIN